MSGPLPWRRLPIEVESPEERGYGTIRYNLAESSVADAPLDLDLDLRGLLLCYGDHRGLPELRARIAATATAGAPSAVGPEHVLCAPGAAGALFFTHVALLGPGRRLVVVSPNYSSNLETPRVLGAEVVRVPLRFEEGWRLDLDRLRAAVVPGTTLVSLTVPHNPTGATLTEAELRAAIAIAEAVGARILVDETYHELARADLADAPLPAAASISPAAISVGSMSKAWGLPGLRAGWLITRDAEVLERALAVKEQVAITGSIVDETLALELLRRREARLAPILATVAARRAVATAFFSRTPHFEWVEPAAGVVAFPRLVDGIDPARFHVEAEARGVMVGPGRWFDQPDRYLRVGFAWPGEAELRGGLAALDEAAAAARVP